MKFQWTVLLSLVFAVIIAVFAVFNVESVPVNFLFSTEMIPLVLVILGSALLGALVSGLFAIYKSYSGSRRVKDLEKQLHEKELEITAQRKQMQEMEERIDELQGRIPVVDAEIISPERLY
ncbi:lipopolysaccharide assembly protein LapA domain-containing protein [Sporosarcina sp. GW1-11]|uniref:LapA family protein n=1 Tax=Sporosarcina sp. GW1-11 TaxID=2899126 RepID=UPI00294DBA17|nr:lipopolysaccharide assembly protein LapA domain-containing protein [Sporosarcina sp. GW1-11]MDV6377192.1 lipopolysaccharide assembly protein LapA domain-containing protein [Sporosarcina sp. GW1-11]